MCPSENVPARSRRTTTRSHETNVTVALVDAHVESGRGGRRAFTDGDETWTYDRLLEETSRFANLLDSLGIRPGDRVILLLPDSLLLVQAFLGAIRHGSIPVPLNTWMPPGQYAPYLEDSEARALLVDGDLLGKVVSPRAPYTRLTAILASGTAGPAEWSRAGLPPVLRVEDALRSASAERAPAAVRASDPAFWLYSSGTTGRPKGVVHHHASMTSSAEHYARQVLRMGPEDRVISAAKLFFAYGLGNSVYFPLHTGAESVLFGGRCTPRAVYGLLEKSRPTLFFAVPTLYAAMLQHAEDGTSEFDFAGALDSVRLCVSAGEALPAELYRRWKERFDRDILDGIGSTEMVHIFISNTPERIRPGSTGVVVPGYEARVVDEARKDVAEGSIGNLLVRGDTAFLEYWGRPEETRRIQRDGWVFTGDKYRVDRDGTYWYAGRSDDMLKVSGLWVSPFEVEEALMMHPAVQDCAVIGVRDSTDLVKPKAYVVVRDSAEATEDLVTALRAFVKKHLAPHKYPRIIEFVDVLPRTVTGKLQRYKLRQ